MINMINTPYLASSSLPFDGDVGYVLLTAWDLKIVAN